MADINIKHKNIGYTVYYRVVWKGDGKRYWVFAVLWEQEESGRVALCQGNGNRYHKSRNGVPSTYPSGNGSFCVDRSELTPVIGR